MPLSPKLNTHRQVFSFLSLRAYIMMHELHRVVCRS